MSHHIRVPGTYRTDCPAEKLNSNPPFQRALVPADARVVAVDYDSDYFGVLVIAIEREMTYDAWLTSPLQANLVDGQQRWYGATQDEDGPQLDVVPVLFYDGKSMKRQAEMFGGFDHRRSLQPWDKLRHRVISGDRVAIDMHKIAADSGFRLYDDKAEEPGGKKLDKDGIKVLRALWNVERAYLIDGSGKYLAEALRNHAVAFPDERVRGDYLVAHARTLARFDDTNIRPDVNRLREALWGAIAEHVSNHPSRQKGKNQGGGSLAAWEEAVRFAYLGKLSWSGEGSEAMVRDLVASASVVSARS